MSPSMTRHSNAAAPGQKVAVQHESGRLLAALLFAGTARRMAHRVMDVLNSWARKRAVNHAAARQAYLLLEREAQRNPQQAAPAAPEEQVPATASARMRGRQFDLYYV